MPVQGLNTMKKVLAAMLVAFFVLGIVGGSAEVPKTAHMDLGDL
jgi:hypothetical protein